MGKSLLHVAWQVQTSQETLSWEGMVQRVRATTVNHTQNELIRRMSSAVLNSVQDSW